MNTAAFVRPSAFWVAWLTVAAWLVIAFGAALVLAPGWACAGFSLLLYGEASRIEAFGAEAVRYVALAHAVLGSVMTAWGVALLLVARGPFARGEREAWRLIAACILVWFVPDTAFSLGSGFWRNAVLNLGFASVLAAPLIATRRLFQANRR